MQLSSIIVVAAFLVCSECASNCYSPKSRPRRDGILSLYPYARTGRGSVQQTWELPYQETDLDYATPQKRHLYAFPRVGRSDAAFNNAAGAQYFMEKLFVEPSRNRAHSKRESETTDTNGMWFGPRLGRSFKPDSRTNQEIPENHVHNSPMFEQNQEIQETDPFEDRKKRQTQQN